MRRRGRAYCEIADVLGKGCQLQVRASTVHYFVRTRPLRPRENGSVPHPRR
jgi:hypothetical protein